MTPRERAEQIQWVGKTPEELWSEIEQAINAAVEAEREECAKIANDEAESASLAYSNPQVVAFTIKQRIRARSNASSAPQAD